MVRKLLVFVLLMGLIPLAMGHVGHEHGGAPAPQHPEVSYTPVAGIAVAILLIIGTWMYTKRDVLEKTDRDQESETSGPDGLEGWLEHNFHRLYVFFLFMTIVGAMADGHDHAHGGLHAIVTFGHVVAPGSLLLLATTFGLFVYFRYRRGMSLKEAIPTGYHVAAIALPLFFVGFGLDQLWHIIFGLEQDGIEVMSPTHLWVLFNGALVVFAPLRRAWYYGTETNWRSQIGMLASGGFLLWILSYLMWILYPYGHVFPSEFFWLSSENLGPTVGVAGMMVFSMIVMLLMLHIVDRFDVVPGGLTFMYALGSIGMLAVTERFYFVPAVLITGFAADLLNQRLDPGSDRIRMFRLFAFSVPVVFALTYYLTAIQFGEILYVVHVWAGSIVFAGFGGVMMSYAIQPFRPDWRAD